MNTTTLLLVRNGETPWNIEHRFLGWSDVELTDAGRAQATRGGELLAKSGLLPDIVHTSLLQRGIDTAQLLLAACGRPEVPVTRDWRLNERHYGILQGQLEDAARAEYGDEAVTAWRTQETAVPPALPGDAEHSSVGDSRYAMLPDGPPRTESLIDAETRVLEYFRDALVPDLRRGVVLVSTHGNPLRALVAHLAGVPHASIRELNAPGGTAVAYRLDLSTMRPVEPPRVIDGQDSPLVLP